MNCCFRRAYFLRVKKQQSQVLHLKNINKIMLTRLLKFPKWIPCLYLFEAILDITKQGLLVEHPSHYTLVIITTDFKHNKPFAVSIINLLLYIFFVCIKQNKMVVVVVVVICREELHWHAYVTKQIRFSYDCMSLVHTTQVNSAFRALWLVHSEVISQYYSPPSNRREKFLNFRLLVTHKI